MCSFRVFHVSRPALLALLALASLMAPAALARPSRPGAQTFPGAQGAIAFVSTRSGSEEIWRMDVDGHGATQLSHAGNFINMQPAWSASGTQLAFVSDRDGNLEIYRMTATGTGVTRLTNDNAEDQEPAWFPGDDRVVFGSLRSSNYDLWTQDVDANGSPVGQPVQLTTNSANDIEPSVSPNGNLIAFVSNRVSPQNPQGDFEIFVMQAAPEGPNNKPQQLTKNDHDDQVPDWAPNGKKLAFASDRNDPGVSFQIFTMTNQGTKERPLTAAGQNAGDPTWSPDGARLAYSAVTNFTSDVFRINANRTHQTNLTEESGFSFDPTWQPR